MKEAAYIFVVLSWISMYLLTKKNITGFYTFICVNIFFFIYGAMTKQYFMLVSTSVNIILNIRGIKKWSDS